jgi:FixJ family two-component response regulator
MTKLGDHYIYLVDDDEPFRQGLNNALKSLDYKVQAFESADAFLEHQDILWPAILISDVRMPGKTGIELQKRLLDENLGIPVIFITGEASVEEAVAGLKRGAIDFIQKPFNMEVLLSVIEKAFEKQRDSLAKKHKAIIRNERLGRLAPREREVADLIVQGYANPKIAFSLYLSIETVKQYKKNIYSKLGVEDLASLMAFMREE